MFAKTSMVRNIIEARAAEEVFKILEAFPQDTMIFFDVDDTLITPQSTSFRKLPNLIEEIKKDSAKYKNFPEILSNWRLQRKIILLDNNWPKIILKLMEKHRVYALTKMDSGKFGNIESIEDWRYKELKSLKIQFTNDIANVTHATGMPVFYKGIFYTGVSSKSSTLEFYHSNLKARRIVLVDDRLDHLEDISSYCMRYSIEFSGILYKGLENIPDEIDPDLSNFQKEYLINHSKWLEDEEARKLMQ
jgi:hypothetical protein